MHTCAIQKGTSRDAQISPFDNLHRLGINTSLPKMRRVWIGIRRSAFGAHPSNLPTPGSSQSPRDAREDRLALTFILGLGIASTRPNCGASDLGPRQSAPQVEIQLEFFSRLPFQTPDPLDWAARNFRAKRFTDWSQSVNPFSPTDWRRLIVNVRAGHSPRVHLYGSF
jgi:hypothetical protein